MSFFSFFSSPLLPSKMGEWGDPEQLSCVVYRDALAGKCKEVVRPWVFLDLSGGFLQPLAKHRCDDPREIKNLGRHLAGKDHPQLASPEGCVT